MSKENPRNLVSSDCDASDGLFYVTIPGQAEVIIEATDKGISVRLYPAAPVDFPVAECFATYAQFKEAADG